MQSSIQQKSSLDALPYPKKWWKCQFYVTESEYSANLSKIRGGNASLGNRDQSMANYGPSDSNGRILICQLCKSSKLTEIHVIIECPHMVSERRKVVFHSGTLHEYIQNLLSQGFSSQICLRDILRPCENGTHAYLRNLSSSLTGLILEYKKKWLIQVEARRQI